MPMKSFQEAISLMRIIPDFPKPGILFQDITPILADDQAFTAVINEMSRRVRDIDVVAGVDARGFILGSAIAHNLKMGFIPIRKSGKLPYAAISRSYGLEYATATLEIHRDAVVQGTRVLLVDDILATGGTLIAAIELIAELGGVVSAVSLLSEISELNGRQLISERYPAINIHILSNS